jgi:hypothetical protein
VAIRVNIYVENPDELLSLYGAGALIRVESATTYAGSYTELGTVPIVSQIYSYVYNDTAGTTTATFYRTRYSNVGNSLDSDYSDIFQGGYNPGLCDLIDVKQRLWGATADTTTDQDETLSEYITQVTDWIQGRTGQTFLPDPYGSGTSVHLFHGYDASRDGTRLWIPQGIRSVTTLEIAQYTTAAFVTMPAGTYFLDPSVDYRKPGWPPTRITLTDYTTGAVSPIFFFPGYNNIRVTGAFGWATVPPAIQNVAASVVVKAFKNQRTGYSDTIGNGEYGQTVVTKSISDLDYRTVMRYAIDPVVAA